MSNSCSSEKSEGFYLSGSAPRRMREAVICGFTGGLLAVAVVPSVGYSLERVCVSPDYPVYTRAHYVHAVEACAHTTRTYDLRTTPYTQPVPVG